MSVPDAVRLRELERENMRLKKLVAERDLEIEVMKEVAAKNGKRISSTRAGALCHDQRALKPPRVSADGSGSINFELPESHGCQR
jgi:putative transposase